MLSVATPTTILSFADDAPHVVSFSAVDPNTGAQIESVTRAPLYELEVKRTPGDHVHIAATEADSATLRFTGDAAVLETEHRAPHAVAVTVTATPAPDGSLHLRLRLRNRSAHPVVAIRFPVAYFTSRETCRSILYPKHEGVLLRDPLEHFTRGRTLEDLYPGRLSCQLLYASGNRRGLYFGCHDAAGNSKSAEVRRVDACGGDAGGAEARGGEAAVGMGWVHRFPDIVESEIEIPYPVVVRFDEPIWQAGADIYKSWARRRSWCDKLISERDMPEWLASTRAFLNFTVRGDDRFNTPDEAARTLEAYSRYIDAPAVGMPFGWEKHGSWISPDYFPPYPNEEYWKSLAAQLAPNGHHLSVMLSGFRWGVRKTRSERTEGLRQYTVYDGRPDFEKRGKACAIRTEGGELLFRQHRWADNYNLCHAHPGARRLVMEAFRRSRELGFVGTDLDQDLGAEGRPCWAESHDHPPGHGQWLYHAMRSFLEQVYTQPAGAAEAAEGGVGQPRFMGVEEPCEVYLPWFDIYHGRAFTYDHWPASGPGAMSVPLFAYLYHPYALGYAGFCDTNFSPLRDPRRGILRAFLYGMQPGFRVSSEPFVRFPESTVAELKILRMLIPIYKEHEAYLLRGDMLWPPVIETAPELTEGPLPTIEATAWRAPTGSVAVAVVNQCDEPVDLRVLEPIDASLHLPPWSGGCVTG